MASTTQDKEIEELQMLENQLQNLLMQKQAFQIEMSETENALDELKNSDGEVYKITAGVILKTNKEDLHEELEEKKKLLDMKISAVDKQEKLLDKRSSDIRAKIIKEKGSS